MAHEACTRGRRALCDLIAIRAAIAATLLALIAFGTHAWAGQIAVPDSAAVYDSTATVTVRPLPDTSVTPTVKTSSSDTSRPFYPPFTARSEIRREYERAIAGADWPMPDPKVVAAGDLADWLTLFPGYDVDDAPGAGENRFYTHWGLAERAGDWLVDGRPIQWQRLSFPERAQFDPGIVPSFAFQKYHVGEEIQLEHDTLWGPKPRSSYFVRQGDFADTYSEAMFRRRFRQGIGIDLGFTFLNSDGRFVEDDRKLRHLDLQAIGPARHGTFWSYRFTQFRDKSMVVTPEMFDSVHPDRDDLLWQMEATLYRPALDGAGWTAGLTMQSGKQDLNDAPSGYHIHSRDRLWSLWGTNEWRGWLLDGNLDLEELNVDNAGPRRWLASAAAGKTWTMAGGWSATSRLRLANGDTDPLAPEATVVLTPGIHSSALPVVRVERTRTLPTLFDRNRPRTDSVALIGSTGGVFYSESGTPDLPAQWTNALSVRWGAAHSADSSRQHLSIETYAAYVEDYIRWDDTLLIDTLLGAPVLHDHARPTGGDCRTVGVAIGAYGPLWRKIVYDFAYAAKYAATLDGERLPGYYPHKAHLILSWIAPQFRYKVDLRLNAIGLWWYADRRIVPTLYTEPHVFRFDLSGSATMKSFTFYALMQNVAGFAYRTQAGYPYTGRMLRFGIDWHFLD
ncbi:MAG: hypothetical protein HY304_00100 [candidate division Zixibacteria bacterium]|nr:hypothetical protein [candidate division Zixibacteria bacterium]